MRRRRPLPPAGELPLRRPGARWGERGFLAAAAAALWLAAALLFQPPFAERAGPDALPHLSEAPLLVEGMAWGADARGPGAAFADAEALLLTASVLLLLLAAAVGGLGQMALAGVVAVSRRFELRLRRALGASRDRLLARLAREAVATVGVAALVGGGIALALAAVLGSAWPSGAAVPAPAFPVQPLPVLLAVGALGAWAVLAFGVVQTGEMGRGAPLRRDTPLGEPYRGELCHPGVPILQVAAVTAVLITAGLILEGPDLAAGEAASSPPPAGERLVVELPPDRAAEAVASLLGRAAGRREGRAAVPLSVTSPGFWEGVGHVRYAETECGRCFIPGSPPMLAPYKGERAVHHAVSPDTFRMAGIVVLEGRAFTRDDAADAEPVAMVSRAFALEHFQDGEALGRRVRIGADRRRWHTVVGVVEARPRTTLVSRRQPPEDVLVPVAQVAGRELELVAAGLFPLVEPLPGWGLTVRERASPEDRRGAVDRWTRRYASIGWGAGTAAAVLALIGTALTVGRRVREEAPEIALRRAVGATRPRLLLRYLAFGLRVGALGTAIGCWAALFAVDAIVPEGFSRPGALAPLFLPVALALTLTAGLAAAAAAAAGLRGTPREGLEG